VVTRWRKALGVERLNEGSARLRNELNRALGAALKGKPLSPEQVEQRRRTANARSVTVLRVFYKIPPLVTKGPRPYKNDPAPDFN
jgi:hypothetical protein